MTGAPAEFDLIARIRARVPARADVLLGIGDDAAIVRVPPDHDLVVSTDTLNAGVHFPNATAAADIGWKALAVNLSDLAAMAAQPAWCTLNLSLPAADPAWLDGFLDGFCELADAHRVALIGGDTTRGPLSISVTVHGLVPSGAALRRDGARPGDAIWVSGTLGDAAAGLALLQRPASPFSLREKVPKADEGTSSGGAETPVSPASPFSPREKVPKADEGTPSGGAETPVSPASPFSLREKVPKADEGEASVNVATEPVPQVIPFSPREKVPQADEGTRSIDATAPTSPASPFSLREKVPKADEGKTSGHLDATVAPIDLLRARLDRPTPRVELGLALRGIASAGIDISDGLLADLGHILNRSRVGAQLEPALLPTSPALAQTCDTATATRFQLGGGDDYELCFTAPAARSADVLAAAARAGVAVTRIGQIQPVPGLYLRDPAGILHPAPTLGYVHFAPAHTADPA